MRLLPFVLLAACTPSPRDVVGPEPTDVRGAPADAGTPTPADAYVYVARRPHGAVGLAEARSMKDGDARAFVDHVAEELERCTAALDARHALVDGAARVIAVAGPGGTPAVSLKVAPGDAVAQTALLCLVAPVRAATLPEGASLAIEATWHPAGAP